MPPLDITAGVWAEASLAGKVPPIGFYRILVKGSCTQFSQLHNLLHLLKQNLC